MSASLVLLARPSNPVHGVNSRWENHVSSWLRCELLLHVDVPDSGIQVLVIA
jgi:hypothetical protein